MAPFFLGGIKPTLEELAAQQSEATEHKEV